MLSKAKFTTRHAYPLNNYRYGYISKENGENASVCKEDISKSEF
jgi:hypothetical protein